MRLAPLSIATAVLAALTLTSCSSTPAEACTPALDSGSLLAATTVSDAFGTTPEVELPDDVTITTSEREVITSTEDSHTYARKGDLVSINFAVLDATTGNVIDGTTFDSERGAAPVLLDPAFAFPGLYKGLFCAQPGERLAIAVAPADGLGEQASASWGIAADSPLIMVIDVLSVGPAVADGKVQQLPKGFPNVVTTETGQVGIVLPPTAPPTELRTAQRIKGTGSVVGPDDVVIGQALTVDWSTRQVLQSTWDQGSPTSFGTESQGTEIRSLLTGYTVGSQVVLIVPSSSGSTVSVVDIIGVG